MMRVIALICELATPEVCAEVVHNFVPRQPIACIHAAGPELAPLIPEGWTLRQYTCTIAPRPIGR